MRNTIGVVVIVIGAVAVGLAQVDTGSLVGTVKDASGAVLANASVSAVNTETGVAITAKTNQNGDYVFTPLKIGRYSLFDQINRRIGYNVRPSFIWSYEDGGYLGLIVGFANDGIAGVPGVLRVTVENEDGKPLKSGCLDPGYPLPGKVRQAQFILPQGTKFKGLRLRAEIEVKSMRYPVRWACHQKLNDDGSLTLRPNLRRGV